MYPVKNTSLQSVFVTVIDSRLVSSVVFGSASEMVSPAQALINALSSSALKMNFSKLACITERSLDEFLLSTKFFTARYL